MNTKKLTIIILVIILLVSLTGCDFVEGLIFPPSTTKPSPTSSETTPTPTPPTVEDTEPEIKPYDKRKSGHFAEEINKYYVQYYLPTCVREDQKVGLLVMLNGENQTGEEFMNSTQMATYAESNKFAVVFIEQQMAKDENRCWRSFEKINQTKNDSGEAFDIVQIINEIVTKNRLDETNVVVSGFGEGASMALNLSLIYNDMFKGVATVGGTLPKSAKTYEEYKEVADKGAKDPMSIAENLYEELGDKTYMPEYLLFQSSKEKEDGKYWVYHKNAYQIVMALCNIFDRVDDEKVNESVDALPDKIYQDKTYTLNSYNNKSNESFISLYSISDIAFTWSEPDGFGRFSGNGQLNISKEIADHFFPVY